jgi:glutamate-1-semialdehyde aminotransferase
MGSCFGIHFTDAPIENYRGFVKTKDEILSPSLLNLGLLNRGFYLSKRGSGYISVVNTEAEIDSFLNAFSETLKDMVPVIEAETPELLIH